MGGINMFSYLGEKHYWKQKEDNIVSKDDFLNGLEFGQVSDIQQMFYLQYKKIEELEERIKKLEEVKINERSI